MTLYNYDLGKYHGGSQPDRSALVRSGPGCCYGYSHEEAGRYFQGATKADPSRAMTYWGIAYSDGPNHNKQWKPLMPSTQAIAEHIAWKATQKVLACLRRASPMERALVGSPSHFR
jgi:hypothetical protein